MLSEQVEIHETGQKFDSNWSKFFNDILRTIGGVIVGGIFYFIIYISWVFFAWMLGLSFLSPFFFFKQKTAYEIGLGIPAEPLFRSPNAYSSSNGWSVFYQ